jgi:hypothetical protein
VRDVLILVGLWCAAVTAIAAAVGVVWKILEPGVDRYLERTIRRETAPLVKSLETVRTEIVSAPADPSLLETASAAVEAADRVEHKVDALHNQLGRVSRRVEQVDGRVMITQSVLDQHVTESKEWLSRAVEALEDQGIDLPDQSAGNPHDER